MIQVWTVSAMAKSNSVMAANFIYKYGRQYLCSSYSPKIKYSYINLMLVLEDMSNGIGGYMG